MSPCHMTIYIWACVYHWSGNAHTVMHVQRRACDNLYAATHVPTVPITRSLSRDCWANPMAFPQPIALLELAAFYYDRSNIMICLWDMRECRIWGEKMLTYVTHLRLNSKISYGHGFCFSIFEKASSFNKINITFVCPQREFWLLLHFLCNAICHWQKAGVCEGGILVT